MEPKLDMDLMNTIFGIQSQGDWDDDLSNTHRVQEERRQAQADEPAIGERADVFIKSEHGDQLIVSGDVVDANAETFTVDCKTPDRRVRRTTYQRATHFMYAAEVVNVAYTSDTTPPTVSVYPTEWELRGTDESGE